MYSGFCSVEWTGPCSGSQCVSGIPYGNQTEANSLIYENGFKGVRGAINEGHYLVFEANGYALSNPSDGTMQFGATKATAAHDAKSQRWVIHGVAEEGASFKITSAVDGLYISQHSSLSVSLSGSKVYDIVYIGDSQNTLQKENGRYLNIAVDGTISLLRSRCRRVFIVLLIIIDKSERRRNEGRRMNFWKERSKREFNSLLFPHKQINLIFGWSISTDIGA
jgi:phospholipase C